MYGKLFVFEGPDGVGKTTLSKLGADMLNANGQQAQWISFPGREPGTVGQMVYALHHDPQALGVSSLTDAAKQTLHIAAHLDAIERTIRPVLSAGTHVVLDRFWWSTWVYGITAGLDEKFLRSLIAVEQLYWASTQPALLLLVEAQQPRDRANEGINNFLILTTAYRELAVQESTTYPIQTLNNDSVLSHTQKVLESFISSCL